MLWATPVRGTLCAGNGDFAAGKPFDDKQPTGMTKMDLNGLTDSFGTPPHEDDECPHCCGVVRVHNGLCLGCLVQTGLAEEHGCESENLDTLLAEIE